MAKNIVVRDKDYTPSYLNGVKRIRTELQDGGLQNWVPEDELFNTIEKEIFENGVYIAAEENAGGYSSVIVKVDGGGSSGARCPRSDVVSQHTYEDSIWRSSISYRYAN